jgi:hypothetical protein
MCFVYCTAACFGVLQTPVVRSYCQASGLAPKNKGEFILENFFELFELVLSYITNTISLYVLELLPLYMRE